MLRKHAQTHAYSNVTPMGDIFGVWLQVKELAKSMLAAKSFNPTSAPAQLDRWMRILAEELSHRLTEDGIAHSRAPRSLSLSYRCCHLVPYASLEHPCTGDAKFKIYCIETHAQHAGACPPIS